MSKPWTKQAAYAGLWKRFLLYFQVGIFLCLGNGIVDDYVNYLLSVYVLSSYDTLCSIHFDNCNQEMGIQFVIMRKHEWSVLQCTVADWCVFHYHSCVTQIQSSKVATLKNWLQSKGLKFHSREKKDNLVKQVVQHVQETGAIFTS